METTHKKYAECRNKINRLIDDLVAEILDNEDSYKDAVQSAKGMKYKLYGDLGEIMIDEVVNRIYKIALEKATKE